MAAPMKLIFYRSGRNINNINGLNKNFGQTFRFVNIDPSARNVAHDSAESTGAPPNAVVTKLTVWMKFYEDLIGITDVKTAQNRVIATEEKLLENQEIRRERQLQSQQVQMRLKEIQLELDKSARGEDRYLQLVTQEHTVLREERHLNDELKVCEKAERDYFMALSNAVRDSHERQRAYAEKTKYWSIIGSVGGAIIGIIGTTVNNWVRLRELRDIVYESAKSNTIKSTQAMYSQLLEAVTSQQEQMSTLVADVRGRFGAGGSDNAGSATATWSTNSNSEIKSKDFFREELAEIKALMTASKLVVQDGDVVSTKETSGSPGAVVYLGRDVERLVKDAQNNLEWKIKINSLATVAMIYGIAAISIPILYKILGGGS